MTDKPAVTPDQQARANRALLLRLEIENLETFLATDGFSAERKTLVRDMIADAKAELEKLVESETL